MKKKLMMVAVLLGALSLGACVDDNESQSVTDLRNAKAAQLNAVAALYQAQADAAAETAAAEAELIRAKAALKQAQASQKEEEIRQAQEEFELQIAALQAKWEYKMVYWQSLKAQYEGQLWTNESTNVQNAYSRYTTALDAVYSLNQSLMEQQVQKAQLEANIISVDEAVERTIAGWNEDLAEEQRELAKLQEIQKATPSMEEYKDMMDQLEIQAYDIVNNKATTALADQQSKRDAYQTKFDAIKEGDTYAVVPAIETLNQLATDYASSSKFAATTNKTFAADAVAAFNAEYSGVSVEGTFQLAVYEFVANDIEIATLRLDDAFKKQLEADEKAITDATGKAWEKDKDGNIIKGTDETSVMGAQSNIDYHNQLIDKQNKLIASYNAQVAAGTMDKDEATQKIQDAQGEIERLKGLLTDLEVAKLEAEKILEAEKTAKEETLADQKAYTDALAVLNKVENQTAYTDAVAALEPLAVAYVEAQAVAQAYENQLADLGFEFDNGEVKPLTSGSGSYQDIELIVNGVADVQDLIDDCTEAIAGLETLIESATATGMTFTQNDRSISYWNPVTQTLETIKVYYYTANNLTNGVTQENALALIDLNIANITEKLTIQQALVEKYKDLLNSLLGAEEGEVPSDPVEDTPAEDTPSEEQPAA